MTRPFGDASHLAAAILDASSAEIAVLDRAGVIVHRNRAWATFAQMYRTMGFGDIDLGANYLEVLETRGLEGAVLDAESVARIRDVFAGTCADVAIELHCPDCVPARWYAVHVTPLRTPGGGIEGVVLTQADITALKVAESESRSAASRFRAIAENGTEGILFADADMTVRYRSPSQARLTGWTDAERLGQNALDVVHPDDVAAVREGLRKFLATPGRTVTYESRLVGPDGRIRWIECTAQNLLDNPDVSSVVILSRDITERKALEEQFRQAQKMEAIGRLAGGVAHDFNNLLSVILGHTEIALDAVDPSHAVYDDLASIRLAAERSAELTRQLLTFARLKPVTPASLDLNARLDGMRRIVERLLTDDVVLEWRLDHGLWPVYADASHVDQILTNLCINARDAIRTTGRVRVTTRNVTLHEADCAGIADAVPGEYVELTVADTGAGIDPHILSSIFEPFFTTKPVGKGTGLGLASVYGAVRQSNGFVHVESTIGTGTTFLVYLPRHRPRATAPQPAP